MGGYTSGKSHPNPSAPPTTGGFEMFYVLRYIPKAETLLSNMQICSTYTLHFELWITPK